MAADFRHCLCAAGRRWNVDAQWKLYRLVDAIDTLARQGVEDEDETEAMREGV